ncbi:hypothetical protein V2G26_001169 [Clonostachys chloroleuca]
MRTVISSLTTGLRITSISAATLASYMAICGWNALRSQLVPTGRNNPGRRNQLKPPLLKKSIGLSQAKIQCEHEEPKRQCHMFTPFHQHRCLESYDRLLVPSRAPSLPSRVAGEMTPLILLLPNGDSPQCLA